MPDGHASLSPPEGEGRGEGRGEGSSTHAITIRDRLRSLHDRVLANPAFQRWAAGFHLTRPVAQRRSRALFDLCAGFVYSQTLFACVELGVFPLLEAGPQSAEAIAAATRLPVENARRLLLAASSLRLISARGERFGLGVLGAAMLGNPAVTAMVRHHALLYADLRDPVALLRGERPGTALSQFWPYARDETGESAPYSALMAESQALVAADILEVAPLRRAGRLMDVGGGDGSFAVAAARRWPSLQVTLFDLPDVATKAQARFKAAGLTDRAAVLAGDFRRNTLPSGADAISFVRVLHDHDDATVATLLCAARAALPAGGRIIIAEPMADTPGAEPIGHAYFGLYLLAMGRGRPRTSAELRALLNEAGFDQVRERRTRRPMLVRVIVARA